MVEVGGDGEREDSVIVGFGIGRRMVSVVGRYLIFRSQSLAMTTSSYREKHIASQSSQQRDLKVHKNATQCLLPALEGSPFKPPHPHHLPITHPHLDQQPHTFLPLQNHF